MSLKSSLEPVLLRGTGADEASALAVGSGNAAGTMIFWRKGRNWGYFALTGPQPYAGTAYVEKLLKALMRRF